MLGCVATVSVTALLVTLPAVFETTQWYWYPFSTARPVTLKVFVVALASVQFVHALDKFFRYCH